MKGHIRARGEGCWAIVLDIGRDPRTGKRQQKWHTVRGTKRDAQREMTKLLNEVNAGSYVEPSKLPIPVYLERWLADYAKSNVSAKTFERYSEIVHCHLAPAFRGYKLAALRPLHIQGYYTEALKSGRRGGLSARTVLHHHRVLRQALPQAVKWQMLSRNPTDAVEPPRALRTEMRALDEDQIAALLEVSKETRLGLIILLAVTTGLRRGEILAIRWQDFDVDARTISVRQSLEQTKAGLVFKSPKTEKSRRMVALPELAIAALRRHKIEQGKARLMLGAAYNNADLICAAADGRPLPPREITHAFGEFMRRHPELSRLRFHDLRHSHATMLLRSGVHPKIVSEWLGHSTIGITLDVYSHVLPGMQEEAARKVDQALDNAVRRSRR